MALGIRKYEGKGDMLKSISMLDGNAREQGSKFFYFTSDSFALSIMISDLTNKPASEIFYENAFKKFSTNKFMHWVSDKKGSYGISSKVNDDCCGLVKLWSICIMMR